MSRADVIRIILSHLVCLALGLVIGVTVVETIAGGIQVNVQLPEPDDGPDGTPPACFAT